MIIETYNDFVAKVKAQGCKTLLREINTYGTDAELPVLYAEANGTLIGTWSPIQLGRIFPRSVNWSKRLRKFEKIAI